MSQQSTFRIEKHQDRPIVNMIANACLFANSYNADAISMRDIMSFIKVMQLGHCETAESSLITHEYNNNNTLKIYVNGSIALSITRVEVFKGFYEL